LQRDVNEPCKLAALAAENQRASKVSGGELLTRGVFAEAVQALPDADVVLGPGRDPRLPCSWTMPRRA
jgi:hypothetical protein